MLHTKRPKKEKNIMVAVSAAAIVFLAAGGILGLLSAKEMRNAVTRQFNEEQLVVAHFVKRHVEKELDFLKKEIALLAGEISERSFDPAHLDKKIQQAHSHVLEVGVRKIEIVDVEKNERHIHTLFAVQPEKRAPDPNTYEPPYIRSIGNRDVWVSPPRLKSNEMMLALGVSLEKQYGKMVLFHVDITWLLSRLLKDIRSGKTGYAWIIDDNGTFLYHPDRAFIGKNAFKVREETYPDISFAKINFIQKEKMLKGLEGTGWYSSGWHRGVTGEIKKLIAFCPVVIAHTPSRRWSVAVVAPILEIEDAVRKGYLVQFVMQGLIILAVGSGASFIIFFERRWSRRLGETVARRTEAFKRSEERYRSLVESAEDFIFTVDPGGTLKSINSFTAKFFGGRPDDFIGEHLSKLFDETVVKKQTRLIRLVTGFGKSVRDEFELTLGDHPVWIDANFMPLKNNDGKINAILCIARDITENKSLEKQLVNTEKLASLGTLAAGVAHEVNNPLGVILGFCDLLLQKADKNSQTYQDLKTIERQGLHCKEVIENLLSFSRVRVGSSEYSDLNLCIDEIINVVKHTLEMNEIELVTDQAENLPPVRGDSRQLQQVFLNLINNAIAAMENGGVLKIRSRFQRRGRMAVIDFSDNGTGIAPENMDRIFEPFFTTKPEGEGTGLGLFVSYGIVNKFGGSLSCVSSTVDDPEKAGSARGTTFTIQLPVKQGEG
ncbi:MAG: PAS domain S-box protein [Desulfosarcina sp.]|nr:PAS domain S-box protein [Desulfosarcina sp.]MBC2743671.1 PAS domain S-box protein [Desulfosarcina sp.]MBC2766580.1 PAS domain S-box protein [Desulfosarcina sp.]